MIIGMYLITPYLRCFVSCEKKNMVLCFIAVSLVAQFIAPVTDILSSFWQPFAYISSFISKFKLNFFCGFPVYYLTGWYIVHIGFHKKIMKYGIYIASILSVIITFLAVQITGDYDNGYSNTNIFIFMYSVGVFYALFNMKIELNQRKEYIIEMMSKLTFGVYIVHPIFLDVLKVIIPLTNPLLHIILVFVLTIVISFAVCYIMSKNAITKKLIRM
jgi:peptidoglycan/LPS O-acetylase OafA/YrhL